MRGPLLAIALVAAVCLSSVRTAQAITPPDRGRFPAGFWARVNQDTTIARYGDPGWVRKMSARRITRERAARAGTQLQGFAPDRFNLPVLLGNFSDKSPTIAAEDFQAMLFIRDQYPTGSLADYYHEVSYGQFELVGDAFGWYATDNPQSYYAGDDNGMSNNFPNNVDGFVYDVARQADAMVDFSRFDNDGPDGEFNSGDDDGYVDCLYVIYPGIGPENTVNGDPGNLWPCQSTLGGNAYETDDPSANGGMVSINAFAVSSELGWDDADQALQINSIGVFAHEFGHVLGLPDLYDRTDETQDPDRDNSAGIGHWCLMASGSWGGDGEHPEKPSHMSAWCKMRLGWLSPAIIKRDESVSLPQVEETPKVYQLWEDEYALNRYFLIENRQKVSFDQYLAGDGLVIYHVDESRWMGMHNSNGPGNDDERHKLVDVEEADGLGNLDADDNRGDDGDPFPGSSGRREFGDLTAPDSRDYAGLSTGAAVSNISDSGPVMTADLKVRRLSGYSIFYDEAGISGYGWGLPAPADFWGGVLFRSGQAGRLAALDVGVREPDTYFELSVYQSFDGRSPGELLGTTLGHAEETGWNTVSLAEPVPVAEDSDFFVSLKVLDKAYSIPYDNYGGKDLRSYTSTSGDDFSSSIGESGGDINLRARIRVEQQPQAAPAIVVSDSVLAFGELTVGSAGVVELSIGNEGDAALVISSITTGSGGFAAGRDSLTLPPGEKNLVPVSFAPAAAGDYEGELILLSNDPSRGRLTVRLTGSGRLQPVFLRVMGDYTFNTTEGSYQVWADLSTTMTDPTVRIFYSLDGGQSFAQSVGCTREGERYVGLLPAGAEGSVIRYYFEAAQDSERVLYPEQAPQESFRIEVKLFAPGDVSGDGAVNVFDLLALLRQLSDPAAQTARSDVSHDGAVDIFDLLALLRMMSGR